MEINYYEMPNEIQPVSPVNIVQPQPEAYNPQTINITPNATVSKKKNIWIWFVVGGCGCLFVIAAIVFAIVVVFAGAVGTAANAVVVMEKVCKNVNNNQSIRSYFISDFSPASSVDKEFNLLTADLKGCKGLTNVTNMTDGVAGGTSYTEVTGKLDYGSKVRAIRIQFTKESGEVKIAGLSFD